MTTELQSRIEEIVNEAIPIYTHKKPHPVKNRQDCNLEKKYKEGLRMILTKKVEILLKEFNDKVNAM